MRGRLEIIVVSLALIAVAKPYPDGAPADVCTSMMPGHGVEPQASAPPYRIKIEVVSGGQLIITIKPNKSEDTFKGFLLQVRDKEDKPFGEFKQEIESKLLNCPPGENVSVLFNFTRLHSLDYKSGAKNSEFLVLKFYCSIFTNQSKYR